MASQASTPRSPRAPAPAWWRTCDRRRGTRRPRDRRANRRERCTSCCCGPRGWRAMFAKSRRRPGRIPAALAAPAGRCRLLRHPPTLEGSIGGNPRRTPPIPSDCENISLVCRIWMRSSWLWGRAAAQSLPNLVQRMKSLKMSTTAVPEQIAPQEKRLFSPNAVQSMTRPTRMLLAIMRLQYIDTLPREEHKYQRMCTTRVPKRTANKDPHTSEHVFITANLLFVHGGQRRLEQQERRSRHRRAGQATLRRPALPRLRGPR